MQVSGELQYVEANYSTFHPRSSDVIAVLEHSLFRRAVVDHLYDLPEVKGMAVLWAREGDDNIAHSPDERAPNNGAIRGYAAGGYEWNPAGDGLLYRHYKIPIWLIGKDHSEVVRARALENGGHAAAANATTGTTTTTTTTGMTFHTRMDGAKDTPTCFRRGTCLPLGGQSVISSLSSLTTSSLSSSSSSTSFSGKSGSGSGDSDSSEGREVFPPAKRIVYVTTRMDTTAFFHDVAYGAEGYTSGLIVTLAAQAALAERFRKAPRALSRNIIFAYFSGESYGYLGSRKYVHDLQNFIVPHFLPPPPPSAQAF